MTTKVDALDRALNKVEKTSQRASGRATRWFKEQEQRTREAEKAAKAYEKTIGGYAGAFKKAGGPLGEMIGRLTGTGGLTGGMARVAAVAAVAGIAVRAYTAVVDHNVRKVRESAEAHREMADAVKAGKAANGATAVGALGQVQPMRLLHAMGGAAAISDANAVASRGVVSGDEAREGVAHAYAIDDQFVRSRAISVAEGVAANGGDFSKAIDEIVKTKKYQRRLNPTQA
ncbi:MAG TPA: hypothetical protein VD838_16010, partial [Anaeromyxobacteraceae bacterium]|nr:hypothetical protein [Anaeromyxobacteraceae bacterium]